MSTLELGDGRFAVGGLILDPRLKVIKKIEPPRGLKSAAWTQAAGFNPQS
jgi:hypothetical protein